MQQYLYETHVHTSETSKCGHMTAAEDVRLYRALGYTGMVVTDHLHNVYISQLDCRENWPEVVRRYMAGYRAAKAAAEGADFDVIFGAEIRFPENDNDYLLYGIDEQFLLDNPYLCDMDHQSFFDKFGSRIFIVHAHPYRGDHPQVFAACYHGVEVINCNPRHDSHNARALALTRWNPTLLRFSGSDCHQPGDEGRGGIYLPKRVRDSYEYKDAVTSGEYRLYSRDDPAYAAECEKGR